MIKLGYFYAGLSNIFYQLFGFYVRLENIIGLWLGICFRGRFRV